MNALARAITDFCKAAQDQGGPDPNSDSVLRSFHKGGDEAVDISIDFHHGKAGDVDLENCEKHMNRISDGKLVEHFFDDSQTRFNDLQAVMVASKTRPKTRRITSTAGSWRSDRACTTSTPRLNGLRQTRSGHPGNAQ